MSALSSKNDDWSIVMNNTEMQPAKVAMGQDDAATKLGDIGDRIASDMIDTLVADIAVDFKRHLAKKWDVIAESMTIDVGGVQMTDNINLASIHSARQQLASSSSTPRTNRAFDLRRTASFQRQISLNNTIETPSPMSYTRTSIAVADRERCAK